MKRVALFLTLFVICMAIPLSIGTAFMAAPVAVNGTTVRGLLYRIGPDGRNYPAGGIPTRLTSTQYGPSAFAYSDGDGMYYLYNVPPGAFTLEVWLSAQAVLRFDIRALPQEFTNIPAIRVP